MAAGLSSGLPAAAADKRYDEGASDTEVKIGQTLAYSGPASYSGVVGRIQSAYFEQLNQRGGINGRKVNLISLDDGYSPPKTVEATRRLIEGEGVLFTFNSMGTATQSAVQKYLNAKKIPQLMVSSGASRWNQPDKFPWSTPGVPLYSTEGRVFARWLLNNKPDAKVAILSQNDDLGRDFVSNFREVLGDKAATMIVSEATYDATDPTLDSQLVKLSNSGADVFFNVTVGKFASQSIKKVAELGWKPLQYMMSASASGMMIKAAGPENAKGLIAIQSNKRVGSPRWHDDAEVQAYQAFRAKYVPTVDPADDTGFYAYSGAVLLSEVLRRCGDDLTRANLLKQATDLKGMRTPYLLPGLTLAVTATDYEPVTTFYMGRYTGQDWELSEHTIAD
ncbi:branched-chain amino acid ABC transporter substrate-binding protein [Chelatococcus reniformis]|uniref:Branched-chain amino acid ABC transporter substrate-binding protein n=1 Tax=Chelatococcus reniformis TaxID=1494448 RepID=A0A916UUK7_9HYPH|nr:ABC transporter substrate-binding protein [Chelatococcus reniformis]GGC87491.1 branched-chain amino acid ABC transporter substrate-binding protein [Chelatococcus reniformis]